MKKVVRAMAQSTIQLLNILKNIARTDGINYDEYQTLEDFIDDSYHLIFTDYEIFDEDYRQILNKKIVSHFIFQEVSVNPYSRWQFIFNRKLKEIMPYFNRLYKTELLEFNPLHDTEIIETLDRGVDVGTETNTSREMENITNRQVVDDLTKDVDTTSTQSETGNTSSQTDGYKSDTPFNYSGGVSQASELTGEEISSSVESDYSGSQLEKEKRLTQQEMTSGHEETSSSQSLLNTNTSEEYIKKIVGKRNITSYGKVIEEYRKSLLNIDMMIINELELMFRFTYN